MSRSSSRAKTRRLWLHIRADAPGVSNKVFIETLLESIRRGDYIYPKEWKVGLGWKNKPYVEFRWGEFTKEMIASSRSSPGFDIAVAQYLESGL